MSIFSSHSSRASSGAASGTAPRDFSNVTLMPGLGSRTILPGAGDRFDKTGQYNLRTKTYTARTVTDCLLQAKQELGPDAIIVSRRTFRKGALFGRWGGREMVEMTFGTYQPPSYSSSLSPQPSSHQPSSHQSPPAPNLRFSGGLTKAPPAEPTTEAESARIAELEEKLAKLTASIQSLTEAPPAPKPARSLPPFLPASLQAVPGGAGRHAAAQMIAEEPATRPRRRKDAAPAAAEDGYAGLVQQLLEADIALPLARLLVAEVPAGLGAADAAGFLRTVLAQRLQISRGIDAVPTYGKMRLLAFVGTTGVGKTTTIAKLTARYALMERRKVGVITLDTQRIGAAEQLQKYGEILRVPVQVAHDKAQVVEQLEAYAADRTEMVLLDTAGRSPNEMLPLGETAHLFDGVGAVQKFLTLPATLGQRDMENTVTKFQNIFTPDAVILTKLDEATDHTCFGRLLTLQAKFGLPLAFVTTGQRVPDDIVLPDAHAIASRILSAPLL